MIRRLCLAMLAAGVLIAVPAAAASATTTGVVAAIEAQDKLLRSSPEFAELSHFQINTKAQAEMAIPKFRAVAKALDRAAGVVSRASATSAQKPAQAEWVRAAHEGAAGVGQLVTALQDLVAGKATAAKAEARKAEKTSDASNVLGKKADRALGVPKNL